MKKRIAIFTLFTLVLLTAFLLVDAQVNKVLPIYFKFPELADTPNSYVGMGARFVAVNAGETGLEFVVGGGGDAFTVRVDAAAVAGYFGVAGGDGIFRFTANHFTMADGGNFVTLSLADHATARTALGLAIGTNVVAWDADLDTYAGITPSADIQTFLANATYAAMIADLSGTAAIAFDWNAQNLTNVGTIAATDIHHSDFISTEYYSCGNSGASITIDWNNGNLQYVTLTAVGVDITFTEPPNPGECELWIIQDGTGNRTIDWEHEISPKWPGDVEPTLSTGAGDIDVVVFTFIGGTTYRGLFNGNFE